MIDWMHSVITTDQCLFQWERTLTVSPHIVCQILEVDVRTNTSILHNSYCGQYNDRLTL